MRADSPAAATPAFLRFVVVAALPVRAVAAAADAEPSHVAYQA
ncbi:hypothetical protein [Amycolatopsis sp. NPDC051071]